MTEAKLDNGDQNKLAAFLVNNPEVTYSREGKSSIVAHPWGEKHIRILVHEDNDALTDALNAVRLPPRFTAIWHQDTRDLEVIFGPLGPDNELRSRCFEFEFNGKAYSCEFRDASDRLLLLTKAASIGREAGLGDSRNLQLLQFYAQAQEQDANTSPIADFLSTSFWIRGIDEWNENDIVALAQHLNFYMRYFDRETPLIVVHEDLPEQEEKERPVRYPYNAFPDSVSARLLDPFLLGLWDSSVRGNPRLRFLYSYQIVEYAAFYHAGAALQQTVRRAIMSPHTNLNPDRAVTQILDALANNEQHDTEKLRDVVRQSVDPGIVWREMQPHLDYFSKSIEFDGGLTLEPLINSNWTEEDFARAWHPKFTDAVRKIRNSLVHGRQRQMSNVISPTRANDDRLRPWLAPLSVVAEQVMLCRPS